MEAICLQNRCIRVAAIAAAGGKLVELVDVHTGRNWLWANPALPVRNAEYGLDYGKELDSGGWDEMLMSIAPAEIRSSTGAALSIPDHGDVVGQQWAVDRVEETTDGTAICAMSVDGRAANYHFRRELRLSEMSSELEVRYQLQNRESFALPFYWSAHALLNITSSMQILLSGTPDYRVESFASRSHSSCVGVGQWPKLVVEDGTTFDLSNVFSSRQTASNFAAKLFVEAGDLVNHVVQVADGMNVLMLRFDPEVMPWLGLWLNNGAWCGAGSKPYRNLGLEPTTASFDSAASAIAEDSVPWIAAGDTISWSLSIELAS